MPGAFEIVMEQRKELVEKIVKMMKEDGFFGNREEWNRAALQIHNPLSGARYRGGNRLRLLWTAIEAGYSDPRWATLKQYREKGYYPQKGEHGVICEKWIFTKERTVVNENGEKIKEIVRLERPQVSYFIVFNAQQIQGFPGYKSEIKWEDQEDRDILNLVDEFIASSECPVKELEQDRACYIPARDMIILPPRQFFKDDISFAKTTFHEMAHSTGHESRLNRRLQNSFGTPDYAREELRAELSSLFMCTDIGISLKGEHFEDHSDYLKSWILALEEDYNELFRACADAEKISDRLIENYERKYQRRLRPEIKINFLDKMETNSKRSDDRKNMRKSR